MALAGDDLFYVYDASEGTDANKPKNVKFSTIQAAISGSVSGGALLEPLHLLVLKKDSFGITQMMAVLMFTTTMAILPNG